MHGTVTREAYIALHLRVGKALQSDFDVIASENNANMDWAEDITAFSGEGAPSHSLICTSALPHLPPPPGLAMDVPRADAKSIWLEEVKKKFLDVAKKVVLELGMKDLFAKYLLRAILV